MYCDEECSDLYTVYIWIVKNSVVYKQWYDVDSDDACFIGKSICDENDGQRICMAVGSHFQRGCIDVGNIWVEVKGTCMDRLLT